jgi:hypothetical protein
VREADAAAGDAVEVGRPHLLVAAEVVDPVVQVVDGDEQDVRLRRRLRRVVRRRHPDGEQEDDGRQHETERCLRGSDHEGSPMPVFAGAA